MLTPCHILTDRRPRRSLHRLPRRRCHAIPRRRERQMGHEPGSPFALGDVAQRESDPLPLDDYDDQAEPGPGSSQ